ncbi:MAG: transporter [Isosphaeraceae bacterium]
MAHGWLMLLGATLMAGCGSMAPSQRGELIATSYQVPAEEPPLPLPSLPGPSIPETLPDLPGVEPTPRAEGDPALWGRRTGFFFSKPPRRPLLQLFLDNDNRDAVDKDDEPEYPRLHDDPLKDAEIEVERVDPFFLPWAANLVFEHNDDLGDDPTRGRNNRLQRRSKVDIRSPGPDTANFPNSAYTLPKGRFYIESSPFTYYGKSTVSPAQYNFEWLIRYGITDNLEFRLYSNGYSMLLGPQTTGFSPLVFDFKIHLWDENPQLRLPAAAIEVYIQTPFGSPRFNNGTQPSLTLNFSKELPGDFDFEVNFGINGSNDALNQTYYNFSIQWALQRELFSDVFLFTHGFLNNSALPRLPGVIVPAGQVINNLPVVVGAGLLWNVSDRLAFFGSYNFGVDRDAPQRIAYTGFAIAF